MAECTGKHQYPYYVVSSIEQLKLWPVILKEASLSDRVPVVGEYNRLETLSRCSTRENMMKATH